MKVAVQRGALVALVMFAGLLPTVAHADGGPLGLDHLVTYNNRGIWNRRYQVWLEDSVLLGEAGAALWFGGEDRFGHTMWQSIDATAVGSALTYMLKYSLGRERPTETSNPDEWFKGTHANSFPSGEVTVISAAVTPVVLEYGRECPAIYALELLPIYDAIGRVKVHGHWQSDVIAGFAIGSTAGYFMHARQRTPLILSVMPHGIYIGLRKSL
ncbi:MAG TPA: phosphatase PAP2 family protein [Steroidobacteraceae bacterium]|jgi:undecaprenyl-diphosphatase